MNENRACLSGRHGRAAAPARAREILRSDFNSDANEGAAAGSPAGGSDEKEAKLAELRLRVQNGTYEVNAEALGARLIDEHIEA